MNTRLFLGGAYKVQHNLITTSLFSAKEELNRLKHILHATAISYIPIHILRQGKTKDYNTAWAKVQEEFRISGSNLQNI